MSELAVQGFRAERDSILEVAKGLTEDEWNGPSDCEGWAIRDVYAHMASTLHGVVDPAFMPDMSAGTEASMESPVRERRKWTIEQVVDEYETYSAQAAEVFASVQTAPLAETMLPMGELGTHPMAMLPATFLFDAYCHLRNDVLTPNGSVDRAQPPRDEQRLGPTIEWMLAGLPWMNEDTLRPIVDRPMMLVLEGAGGGTWTIAPGGAEGRVAVSEGEDASSVATARSQSHDFVIWGTQRRPYDEFVKISGDEAYARAVLDVVNII